MAAKKITKDTTVDEAMKVPGVTDVLKQYGVSGGLASFAEAEMGKMKIGQVCQQYGVDCGKLLTELNDRISKQGK